LVSPATRFVAHDGNATNRPYAEIAGASLIATPALLRDILLASATPVPGRGPHEVGAAFVDDDRVVAHLASLTGLDLDRWFQARSSSIPPRSPMTSGRSWSPPCVRCGTARHLEPGSSPDATLGRQQQCPTVAIGRDREGTVRSRQSGVSSTRSDGWNPAGAAVVMLRTERSFVRETPGPFLAAAHPRVRRRRGPGGNDARCGALPRGSGRARGCRW
jgi:hypothetical protein